MSPPQAEIFGLSPPAEHHESPPRQVVEPGDRAGLDLTLDVRQVRRPLPNQSHGASVDVRHGVTFDGWPTYRMAREPREARVDAHERREQIARGERVARHEVSRGARAFFS